MDYIEIVLNNGKVLADGVSVNHFSLEDCNLSKQGKFYLFTSKDYSFKFEWVENYLLKVLIKINGKVVKEVEVKP